MGSSVDVEAPVSAFFFSTRFQVLPPSVVR